MAYVAIQSVQFPQVFLRMDGADVPTGGNGGTVNCQYGVGPYEVFEKIDEGEFFSLKSVVFEDIYLSVNGSDVGGFSGPGGGVVDCRQGTGPYTKLKLTPGYEVPETYSFESSMPGMNPSVKVYLRIDGSNITEFQENGGGTVNCQDGNFQYETFRLIDIYGHPDTWKP